MKNFSYERKNISILCFNCRSDNLEVIILLNTKELLLRCNRCWKFSILNMEVNESEASSGSIFTIATKLDYPKKKNEIVF